MKKLLIFGSFALVLLLNSCKKDSTETCTYTQSTKTATSAEIAYLQSYTATNYPTAVQDPSGIFYIITGAGTGAKPSVCSRVSVNYSGSIIPSGTVFESNTSGVTFTLGQLIPGWQRGIPLIAKGGYISLFIPPSLAYGADSTGSIPANSYLKFDIHLTNTAD